MKFIGLLMINGENDILEDTLAINAEYVDAFYVLDGTVPNDESERICHGHPKCHGYTRDADLPPSYPANPVDGYRQHLYEQAVTDYGYDNWFLLLHGDEVWTEDPRAIVTDSADGYCFQLPFFFPRAGEEWDYARSPLDQLTWRLGPGWPEFRMFRGGPGVRFAKSQHFNVTPQGIGRIAWVADPILHYPYRSPEVQRERAAQTWDPDNYQHVTDRDAVYWTDEMIAAYQARPQGFSTDLACDTAVAA